MNRAATDQATHNDQLASELRALTALLAQTCEAPAATRTSKRIVSVERTASGQILGFREDGAVFVIEAAGIYHADEFHLPTGPVPSSWPVREISGSR